MITVVGGEGNLMHHADAYYLCIRVHSVTGTGREVGSDRDDIKQGVAPVEKPGDDVQGIKVFSL
mgnify:CR=1 FL=1